MRLLYFSPVHARSYAQRPHFMVRAWLQRGAESVLWVNPYPCRLPQWQDLRRGRGGQYPATPLDPRVEVLDVPALPVEPIRLGRWLNRHVLWRKAWRRIEQLAAEGPLIVGIGRPCALALAALRRLQAAGSFYDAMDNFPEFHRGLSRRCMRRHEEAIAAEVDAIVASSTFLGDKFARRGLRVEKLLNGCETAETTSSSINNARAQEAEPPDAGSHAEQGNEAGWPVPPSPFPLPPSPFRPPVLGYLGCIGHWFDWPLMIRLAQAMPRAQIELVGPCAVPPPTRLPANVRLLPACPQSESAAHLARFSAGLIPFRQNALTAGVDPIKYYEYRAAGLPVLSTRFGEMALRGQADGVYFLEPAGDPATTVSAALAHRDDPAAVIRFRRDNRWTMRFSRSVSFERLWPRRRARRAA